MKKIYSLLCLFLITTSVTALAAKISTDQCIQDAQNQLGGTYYGGAIDIGTDEWPGDGYGAFAIGNGNSWLVLACESPQCSDGGAYGGNMQINSCQEDTNNIVVVMSGTAVNSATITIPKSTTVPAPEVPISVIAQSGISPNVGKGTFSPQHFNHSHR